RAARAGVGRAVVAPDRDARGRAAVPARSLARCGDLRGGRRRDRHGLPAVPVHRRCEQPLRSRGCRVPAFVGRWAVGLASVPANEQERLAALRRYMLLDTMPEPEFDRITTLAAKLFDVPIALVSLVDRDRQWFKSRV